MGIFSTNPLPASQRAKLVRKGIANDMRGARTPGWTYARHDPHTQFLIDFALFVESVRALYGAATARAVVLSIRESHRVTPLIHEGQKISLRLPAWNRLRPEAKWFFYNWAMESVEQIPRDAFHLNLSDKQVKNAYAKDGSGVTRFISQTLVKNHLRYVYDAAGERLTYAVLLEIHFKPVQDASGNFLKEPGGRKIRSEDPSFDALFLVYVPEHLRNKVEAAIRDWLGDKTLNLRRRNSGAPVLAQFIGEHRRFKRGASNTGRSGGRGLRDYSGKTLPHLAAMKRDLEKTDPVRARRMEHLHWATDDIREEAERIYGQFREFVRAARSGRESPTDQGARHVMPNGLQDTEPYRRIRGGYEAFDKAHRDVIDALQYEIADRYLIEQAQQHSQGAAEPRNEPGSSSASLACSDGSRASQAIQGDAALPMPGHSEASGAFSGAAGPTKASALSKSAFHPDYVYANRPRDEKVDSREGAAR